MPDAKILLVEDNEAQAETTKEALEKNGYKVLWVKNGASAIKAAKTTLPDVILLDRLLPDLSGEEVCRWLKFNVDTKGIPIIMLTVKSSIEDKVSGIEAGADDYLPKPYNEIELNAKIYASLRTKVLQDELRLKNRQLRELLTKVEALAITDSLTSLFNRRHLENVLEAEWKKSQRYGHPLTCLLIDIDHFKSVNDTYGHKAGDSVLSEISRILENCLREVDTIARWGGEEFVAVLPNTDLDNGMKAASRVLEKISHHTFGPLPNRRITVSIGLASTATSIGTASDLITMADCALYEAKKNGRNRVEVVTKDLRTQGY